ncbi:MAG: DUF3857 domain-containing protein [Flavobacteriaceae bacterium]|jgi:hypothetical protein|nr:DUF3857 domain-containing protein [Flavobacteriaceae bacterium]
MIKKAVLLFLVGVTITPSMAQVAAQTKATIVTPVLSKDVIAQADAVVLEEEGIIEYEFSIESGFSIIEKVKRSILINSKNGIEQATLTIPFYYGKYGKEEVEIKDYKIARNVANEQIIIKVTKADNRKVDKDFFLKEIIPTDIKVGDIVEYSYIKQRFIIDEIPTWYFQGDIPKLKSIYTVKIPENLTYFISTTGSIDIEKKETATTTGRSLSTRTFGTSYRFRESVLEYKAVNIPALKTVPYSGNINNERSSIRFDLVQFQYPDSPVVNIPYKEADVAKELFKNRNFGGELKQVKFLQKNLLQEEWSALAPKERIDRVMKAINERVQWNGAYGYEAQEGVKQAFLKKTGNSADINLMLVAALNGCGIDAQPVVMSTRMNGRPPILFSRFMNQVVATVMLDDVRYFLDATDSNANLRVMPIENLNSEGWIIGDKGTVTKVDCTPKLFSVNQENYTIDLSADGNARGTVMNNKTLYEAYLLKAGGNKDLLDQFRRDIERRSEGTFLKNGLLKTSEEGGVSATFDIQKFSFAKANGTALSFRPLEFYKEQYNPFTDETRDVSIDFIYPSMDSYTIKVNLPVGYQLESKPKPVSLTNKDSGLMLVYEVVEGTDNTIECKFNLKIAKPLLNKELYPMVKAMYKELQNIVSQELILIKKK